MATLAAHQPASVRPTHWKEDNPSNADLAHIPGETGLPIIGNTFKMLADPPAFTRAMVEKYGRVYKNNAFGGTVVALVGADANELVLFDRQKIFSSEQGWGPILDQLFPRGLMLMDFDHHRADRKALSIAFKPEPIPWRHCSFGPRKWNTALARLRLGTAELRARLHRIGKATTAACPHCGGADGGPPETAQHYLCECVAWLPQRMQLHSELTWTGNLWEPGVIIPNHLMFTLLENLTMR